MVDFLDVLARDARETISEGYYDIETSTATSSASLRRAILNSRHAAVIAEIKPVSPSFGVLRANVAAENLARAMKDGGAIGISILTEPKHFHGSLIRLVEARRSVDLSLLMKDIIVSTLQLDAAKGVGANAVLLMQTLFDRGYCECDLHGMIEYAHSRNLEVLLEVHSKDEFSSALNTGADMIGINNRDFKTFEVDLRVTKKILDIVGSQEKIVVSESGIETATDIRYLHRSGAHAFLIGSAIMTADSVEEKVKELVSAL